MAESKAKASRKSTAKKRVHKPAPKQTVDEVKVEVPEEAEVPVDTEESAPEPFVEAKPPKPSRHSDNERSMDLMAKRHHTSHVSG